MTTTFVSAKREFWMIWFDDGILDSVSLHLMVTTIRNRSGFDDEVDLLLLRVHE